MFVGSSTAYSQNPILYRNTAGGATEVGTNNPFPTTAYGAPLVTGTVTILTGQITSNSLNVNGKLINGLDTGSTLTGTSLSLYNSVDCSTYRQAYDTSGTAISWTVAANRYVKLDPPVIGYSCIKFVSNQTEISGATFTVVSTP